MSTQRTGRDGVSRRTLLVGTGAATLAAVGVGGLMGAGEAQASAPMADGDVFTVSSPPAGRGQDYGNLNYRSGWHAVCLRTPAGTDDGLVGMSSPDEPPFARSTDRRPSGGVTRIVAVNSAPYLAHVNAFTGTGGYTIGYRTQGQVFVPDELNPPTWPVDLSGLFNLHVADLRSGYNYGIVVVGSSATGSGKLYVMRPGTRGVADSDPTVGRLDWSNGQPSSLSMGSIREGRHAMVFVADTPHTVTLNIFAHKDI